MKTVVVRLTENRIETREQTQPEFDEQLAYFRTRGRVTEIGDMFVLRDATFPEDDQVWLMFK